VFLEFWGTEKKDFKDKSILEILKNDITSCCIDSLY